MYQDWQVARWSNTENGETFRKFIMSPVNQDGIITIDWLPSRRYPYNCDQFQGDHQYNIFITDLYTGERIQEATIFELGYGWHQFTGGLKANVVYKITIYDFGMTTDHDFTVTLYTEDRQVPFHNTKRIST